MSYFSHSLLTFMNKIPWKYFVNSDNAKLLIPFNKYSLWVRNISTSCLIMKQGNRDKLTGKTEY